MYQQKFKEKRVSFSFPFFIYYLKKNIFKYFR